jgi:hypothetical protein
MKVKDFITILQNYANNNADILINGERSIVISYNKNTVNIKNKEETLTFEDDFEDDFEDSATEGDGENI